MKADLAKARFEETKKHFAKFEEETLRKLFHATMKRDLNQNQAALSIADRELDKIIDQEVRIALEKSPLFDHINNEKTGTGLYHALTKLAHPLGAQA